MSADIGKAYELLGVKPGVSLKDLKAAHRDLAKVWHPDRFTHDPRLQEKAQEKLKEINEAYDLISSGKIPRPTPPPPQSATASVHHSSRRESSRGNNWPWAVLVFLVFAAVFAITLRSIRQQRALPLAEETVQAEESSKPDEPQSTRPDSTTPADVRTTPQESNSENPATEVAPPATNIAPTVTTVTVTIDPETGLLAKPECKLRSRMTYPSGSQPTGHCTLSHAPPPKESRIKSIAKTVKRSLDQ